MAETITQLLTRDHSHCDDLFATAEALGDAGAAPAAWRAFSAAMERHLGAEEGLLFPALDAAVGGSLPPVQVMKLEHAQLRALLSDLTDAAEGGSWDEVSGLAQTLLVLMEQHNLKEQSVLYPMADRLLGARAGALVAELTPLTGTPRA
ncbi:MAG: hemerythrin domain-containing protein [Deltaproteobacteria bacterium]|nr:hemerythrin domain-containing protein [Deltaproteobacteria bacterium]